VFAKLPELIFRNIMRGRECEQGVVIRRVVLCYALICAILAIFFGELAFHPRRVHVKERQLAEATAARFDAALQEVSVTASDDSHLQGWFARPAYGNGDAVILLHGVGDNRQGMMGFAELFLSNGFAVLVPDSRAEGESGGDFPTYGLKESNDVHRWFEWLVIQLHPNCVFGMGESMGAAILLQSVEKENRFCAVIAESSFASFRQIAYVRVGQFFHTGTWLGRVTLRPAVELAFLYGRATRGINLADASPERSVVGSRVPILLIHGLADANIPFRQSERIRAHDPVDIVLWEVPLAGHCGAVNAAGQEFNTRVLGWFTSHDRGYSAAPPQS
jgi:dipeptidyl aminopeptidase/acylaminoacyl peptidase